MKDPATPDLERAPVVSAAADPGARLLDILWQSPEVCAWEWDVPGGRIVGDPGFAALYGLSADLALNGLTAAQFFAPMHPADRDRLRLAFGGMLRGAEILSKECRLIGQDGAVRWVHIRARTSYTEDGQARRIGGMMLDIGHQKRLEETLRVAQEAGGVGTFSHVFGFGTVSVSHQFCRLLGLHPTADLPVSTVNKLVVPGDAPIVSLAGAPALCELRVRRASDGQMRWLMRRAEHVRDSEATEPRMVGVIYDITDAKHAQEQLAALNRDLEARVQARTLERDRIWHVSPDLLGVADEHGVWRSVNRAWTAVLGWEPHDIEGRDLTWLEPPEGPHMAAFFAADGPRSFESRLRSRAGLWHWLSWTAVRDNGVFYCVARDITAQRDYAAALTRAEEQLRQAQKMEAVGQLTGGVAHDFNNLLAGLSGSLEIMRRRIENGRIEGLGALLDAAQHECQRAASLTHRLLSFSRLQTLNPARLDPEEVVGGLLDLISRTVGPHVTIIPDMQTALWPVLADRNQLESALLNLCINARDAMPGGGALTIRARNWLPGDPAGGTEVPAADGDFVVISVCDTGTGMPPEVAARVFEPFFTTKPAGKGTGLGLSMVYGFAQQSGGRVWLRSAPDEGTIVNLLLPRFVGADAPALAHPAARAQAAANLGTVLVVDDEPLVRAVVLEVLKDMRCRALEAEAGQEALRILRSGTKIDVLVTDVGLPGGMNGRQLADAARAIDPLMPVLFITGYAQEGVFERGGLPAGMALITKPFTLDELAARLGALARRGAALEMGGA